MAAQQPRWFRRNLFLISAIALPFLVTIFFLAATAIPEWLVDDPEYDVLFSVQEYANNAGQIPLAYSVDNGVVTAVVHGRAENGYPVGPVQKLYRFHVRSGRLEEIEPAIPENVQNQMPFATDAKSDPFPVGELSGVNLDSDPVSPDGYELHNEYDGRSSLFGEIFGMGARRYRVGISKAGRVISIAPKNDRLYYSYRNVEFLGWLEPTS